MGNSSLGMKGTHPMSQGDKPVARPESQEIPSEENSGTADEIYIPDYVMHDFGVPKATRADG